ncbi:hypothetical protein [Halorussus salinus]|uniref:hypothetical protein n=1 Tax=Halorussus salinus TaxID=1364935 RepID=UPI00109281C0|nr:hypothetical protein [Halorussus salinus]
MFNKKNILFYAGFFLMTLLGIICFLLDMPVLLSLLSFLVGVISLAGGEKERKQLTRKEKRVATYERILTEILGEKENLEEDLRQIKKKNEEVQLEKQQKSQRFSNLKRFLERKGIDPAYIVEEYGESLKAPLLVLTHFNYPKHNSEKDAEFIHDNLDRLGSQSLQGATRVIPPRSIDQDIESKSDLESWFENEILGGREDLNYRLELLSLVSLSEVFGRDESREDSNGFGSEIINNIFEEDPVIKTKDLAHLLDETERFSLKDELRKNIILLSIPYASENQLEEIIQNQMEIQNELGDTIQISNTTTDKIDETLSNYNVSNTDELSKGIREEANQAKAILESLE